MGGKVKFYFPFLNVFAAAMPFLHVPEELRVSRVQYNCIFSIHRLQPALACVLGPDGEPTRLLPPALPAAELPASLAWPQQP